MKALLQGGVLEGQQYDVADDTEFIRLAKDVNDLAHGFHLYARIADSDIFAAAGSSSAPIESAMVAIPRS